MRPARDITGQRFGKFTVLEKTGKGDYARHFIWRCRCDCGNIVEVPTTALKKGLVHSCGCADRSEYNERRITGAPGT